MYLKSALWKLHWKFEKKHPTNKERYSKCTWPYYICCDIETRKCQEKARMKIERREKKYVDGWSIDGSIITGSWSRRILVTCMNECGNEYVEDDMRTNHIGQSTIYFNDVAIFCTEILSILLAWIWSHLTRISTIWLAQTDFRHSNEMKKIDSTPKKYTRSVGAVH